jgi:tRNA pseudouridine55 synthase
VRDAFLVIDKPAGITSHDVVAAVRASTGAQKVGHTGTLDPFATGVLPLALGGATRLIRFLDESIKVYDATISFGAATDTGDPTGKVIAEAPVPALSLATLEAALATRVGPQMQTPPAYSAVKKDGRPLYAYAREGVEVEVAARPIHIHSIELAEWGADFARVIITCSRGTYARVLAEDIARALGTVGHLSALCRRRSGPFWLEGALSLQAVADMASAEPGVPWDKVLMRRRGEDRVPWRPRDAVWASLAPSLISPIQALGHLPLVDVDAQGARRVKNGQRPPMPPTGAPPGHYLVAHGADLLAVAEVGPQGPASVLVVGT